MDILTNNPSSEDGEYEIDPDGNWGDPPFSVTCDMTGGGWTIIYTEDFTSGDASGWEDGSGTPTPVDTSSGCVTAFGKMLGGLKLLGAGTQTTQSFDLLGTPHSEVAVNIDYVVLQSWDGESALVYVDDIEMYNVSYDADTASVDHCGAKIWKDHGPQPVQIQTPHAADSVTVRVTSSLQEPLDNESFGVDNIVISVR